MGPFSIIPCLIFKLFTFNQTCTMKITSYLLFILCVTVSLCSCLDVKKESSEETNSIQDFVKVRVKDEYSISVPKVMQKTTALNSDASLQYQNIHKEIYTIVTDESKQEFLDTLEELGHKEKYHIGLYRDIQLKRLASRMNITRQSDFKPMMISGLKAESVELDGKVDNIEDELSYFLTFAEGNDKIYMIMSWTLKRRKQEHKNTLLKIVKSFELID